MLCQFLKWFLLDSWTPSEMILKRTSQHSIGTIGIEAAHTVSG